MQYTPADTRSITEPQGQKQTRPESHHVRQHPLSSFLSQATGAVWRRRQVLNGREFLYERSRVRKLDVGFQFKVRHDCQQVMRQRKEKVRERERVKGFSNGFFIYQFPWHDFG